MNISADTNLSVLLDQHPELEDTFLSFGLTCLGCPGSSMETVAEAAEGHGVDLSALLEALNKAGK